MNQDDFDSSIQKQHLEKRIKVDFAQKLFYTNIKLFLVLSKLFSNTNKNINSGLTESFVDFD